TTRGRTLDFFEDRAYKFRTSIPKRARFAERGAFDENRGGINYRNAGQCGAPQRYGVPSRRATRARKSASEPVAVMSSPLSISPSISARMISARFRTLPLRPRMSVARRSRCTICRSKSTTDTFDQDSWWTGGRPREAFGLMRTFVAGVRLFSIYGERQE